MAVIETWFNQDLQKPVKTQYIDGSLFSNNANGNRIGVVVTDNGEPVTISGTVSGYVVVSDGSTVPCTGAKSGNRASILIPPAAYVPGSAFISLFITDGTTVTTLAALSTTVLQTRTGTQVDPGSVVTDWTQTINGAMQDVQTAAANLGSIVATPYASLTYPVPLGKYTYYDGGLYRCISPIASSETFTPANWTAVKLGDDVSDLKSALNKLNVPYKSEHFQFSDTGSSQTNRTAYPLIEGNTYIIYNRSADYSVTIRSDDGSATVKDFGSVGKNNLKVIVVGSGEGGNLKTYGRAVNIDVDNIDYIYYQVSKTLKYEEQSLTDSQKTQSRENIGAASAESVNVLKVLVDQIGHIKPITLKNYTKGYYMDVNGTPHQNSNCFYTDYIDVSSEKYLFIYFESSSAHIITYYNSEKTAIDPGISDFTGTGLYRFEFPENVHYIIISYYWDEIPRIIVGTPRYNQPSEELITEYGYFSNIYIDGDSTRTSTYNKAVAANGINETNLIPCYNYDLIKITTTGTEDTQYSFYDEYLNQTGGYIASTLNKNIVYINIPSNACYVRFAYVASNATTTAKMMKYDSSIKGKKISFLGDSITTYSGWIPTGYESFYPTGDVNSVSKTWWYELVVESGMTLLKNAAWSGSTISGDESDTTGWVGCSDARINELADGNTKPDIICILIGINDFAKQNDITTGSYVGRSSIPTNSTIMMNAYAICLKKIMNTYKDAIVFIGTVLDENTSQFGMAAANTGFPIHNPNDNVTLPELNEQITKLAQAMGAHLIPMHECGLTYWNATSYTADGLHPSFALTDNMRMLAQKYIADYFCTDR